ncbi:hypothetical protein AX15_001381 [Amanita polypyramis BW_CC]|nr:hypothetical protein AX15_001381 [Amanita polypyramis BW_CC]
MNAFSRPFDLAYIGKKNQRYTRHDQQVVHSLITAAEGIIQRSKGSIQRSEEDIRRLLKERQKASDDLQHYRMALAPCNNIPEEILADIFMLVVQDHGPVMLPYGCQCPPQLRLSQVCSTWRRVAIHTHRLWSNVKIQDRHDNGPVLQWLSRAGEHPVMLEVYSAAWLTGPSILRRLLVPFQIEKLALIMSFSELSKLCPVLTEDVLPALEEVKLNLTHYKTGVSFPFFMDRVRSMTFNTLDDSQASMLIQESSIPWAHLRTFHCSSPLALSSHFAFLRKMPLIKDYILRVDDTGAGVEDIAMTHVTDLVINSIRNFNAVVRSFTFPNLETLDLAHSNVWVKQEYQILTQRYNFHRLQKLTLNGCALRLSTLLKDAPELHYLDISEEIIIDNEAIAGVSAGYLGRFLTVLRTFGDTYVHDVLDMAEARHKNATRIIETSSSSKEDITILKYISAGGLESPTRYAKRASTLHKLGITTTFSFTRVK